MFTPAFEQFIRPAQNHNQVWRIFVGAILVIIGYLLGVAAIFAGAYFLFGQTEALRLARAIAAPTAPTETLLLLFSFIGALLAPMLVVRLIHKRPGLSLFGPIPRLLRDFAIAALTLFAVNIVIIVGWSLWFDATPNLSFANWALLLPLVIPALLIQTLAEETVFRGYLQQQLAARFRSPLVWMLLPALGFGALHYDPATLGANTWIVVASTALFALLASDLVRITGSLGAAWGFHFANNFIAIALLSTKGSITGVSLFQTPYTAADITILPILMIVDLIVMGICWLILRHILQR